MKITVVGLGNSSGDLSVNGLEAIRKADRVILKTRLADCSRYVSELGVEYTALDAIYESAGDFDKLNKRLASEVLKAAGQCGSLAYCVPGSGTEDNSVRALFGRTNIEILPAPSAVSGISAAVLPSCSYTCYSAYDLPEAMLFRADRVIPLIVYDLDGVFLASKVKLLLARCYGDEAECAYIRGGEAVKIPLYELDRQQAYDYSSAVLVYPTDLLSRKAFDYYDLVEIMQRLRAENGCPWDRAQTHESIKSNLVEEAYELVEAIELDDAEKMCEENGDVLLQTVFHAEIAEESGEFTFTDMLNTLCSKLIFRHSHIFGADKAADAAGALDTWEKNKRIEKNQETVYDAMSQVPKQFPSLLRAYKVLKKAGKAGIGLNFDPDSSDLTERVLAVVAAFVKLGQEPELAVKRRIDAFVEACRER